MNLRTVAGSEQRRVDVAVELPRIRHVVAGGRPRRRPVPAHRIGERHPEQPVVAADEADQRRGEVVALHRVQRAKPGGTAARQDQRLERPHRPERHDDEPLIRRVDDARATGLDPRHVLEERPAGRGQVRPLGRVLAGRPPAAATRRPRPGRGDGGSRRPWPRRGSRRPGPTASRGPARRIGRPRHRRRSGPRRDPSRRGGGRGAASNRRRGTSRAPRPPGGGRHPPVQVASDVAGRSAAKSFVKTNGPS
jgi:hypothetical protein